MKIQAFLFATLVLCIGVSDVRSQLQPESQRLASEAVAMIQRQEYTGAAELLERAVKIERDVVPRNNKAVGTLLVNLARAKNTVAREKRMSTSNLAVGPVTLNSQLPVDSEIDAHYSEALTAFATLLPAEPLAWTTTALEFGKVLKARPGGSSYESSEFEKVENHYKNAVERLTKEVGADSDSTIKLVAALADLYHGSLEYERAFPLYKRFAKSTEARTGDRSALVAPLRNYVEILVVSGQNVEADTFAKHISSITGVEEKLPSINISGRRITTDTPADFLKSVDVPLKLGQKRRSVWVTLVVDEKGNVQEAKSELTDQVDIKGKNVAEVAEKEARSWKFKPLVIDGARRKTYGRVAYSFIGKD
jgi:hypothetical protein